MPTEINRPSASTIGPSETPLAALSAISAPEARPLGLMPLAVAAFLALALHVASGVMLDRSHASPNGATLDDSVTCRVEASPPQPSLPYD